MGEVFNSEKEIFDFFFSKSILVSPDLVEFIKANNIKRNECEALIERADLSDCAVLNKDMFVTLVSYPFIQINWKDFEKALVFKEFDEDPALYSAFLRYIVSTASNASPLQYYKKELGVIDRAFDDIFDGKKLEKVENEVEKSKVLRGDGEKDSLDEIAGDRTKKQILNRNERKSIDERKREDIGERENEEENQGGGSGKEIFLENLPASFKYEPEDELVRKNPDYNNFEVVFQYKEFNKKREVEDFVSLFRKRYEFLKSLLMTRNNLSSAISIKRLFSSSRQGNESARIIGMVYDIRKTANGNYVIDLEDPTGRVRVLVSKDNPGLVDVCQKLVPDVVIGVEGSFSKKMLFANQIFLPGVPRTSRLRKAPDDAYAIFISDIHVGSNQFLRNDFEKFIAWIRGERGTREHKRLASLVKYIFVLGDLVDGVGIYPNQADELEVKDIYKQYEIVASYLSMIPHEKRIFVIPGNHDAVRLAEPQPVFPKKYAAPLYRLRNAVLLTNPAVVRIHKREDFAGLDVLMYHGYSFDYYVANVDAIRQGGGYDRADLIMRFLLDVRHLAPTHASTLYVPDNRDDYLLIKRVPDFFASGHIHKSSVSNYYGTTLISGSCWQGRTSFQEKVGHHPEPSKVPIVNLRTREIKILCFGKS